MMLQSGNKKHSQGTNKGAKKLKDDLKPLALKLYGCLIYSNAETLCVIYLCVYVYVHIFYISNYMYYIYKYYKHNIYII